MLMITPERCCRMIGSTCLHAITVPRRLMAQTRSKASSVISRGEASPPAMLTPTLLCRMSTRPQRFCAAATASASVCSLVTSASNATQSPPSPATSWAVSVADARLRSTARILAPSRAKRSAVARPLPMPSPGLWPAPTTMAILSARRMAELSPSFSSYNAFQAQIVDRVLRQPRFLQDLVGVGAEHRGGTPDAARILGEFDGKPEHLDRTVAAMVDGQHHLLLEHLRIAEHFGEIHHQPARHAGGVQHRDPVLAGIVPQPLLDRPVDGGAVLHPQRVGEKIGMDAQLRRADRIEKLAVDHLGARRDRHFAVAGAEQAIGRGDPVIVAGALRHRRAGEIIGGEKTVKADQPIGQACADSVAGAGSAAPDQRRANAERAVEPCYEVADRRAGAHGLVARLAGDAHEAAHRLGDEVEGGAVAVGAAGTEAGDVAIDEIGLELFQPRRPKPHLFEDSRPVVLDQHVALGDKPCQDVAAFARAQVEGDRALVAVIGGEIPAQPIADGALVAHRVALARRLYLDDVRPHIGEHHRAERTRENAGEVEHADSGQRQIYLPMNL